MKINVHNVKGYKKIILTAIIFIVPLCFHTKLPSWLHSSTFQRHKTIGKRKYTEKARQMWTTLVLKLYEVVRLTTGTLVIGLR